MLWSQAGGGGSAGRKVVQCAGWSLHGNYRWHEGAVGRCSSAVGPPEACSGPMRVPRKTVEREHGGREAGVCRGCRSHR